MRLAHRIASIAAALITALAVAPTFATAAPTPVVETQKSSPDVAVPLPVDSTAVIDSVALMFPREVAEVTRALSFRAPSPVPTLIDALSVATPRPGRVFTDERQRRDRLLIERL